MRYAQISPMFLRILVYAALGLVLLLLNVWYVRGIRRHFFAEDFLVAPFQVIGTADAEGGRGQALAHMLVARLSEIEREMANVNNALAGNLLESEQGDSLLQDRPADYTLALPTKIFKPLNLDVNVGGVELKGVVAWLQRLFAQNRMLQLSVERGENSARIGGSWNFRGIDPIWIELHKSGADEKLADGEIIDAVAYELAFKVFEKRTPEVGALTTTEFRKLFYALGKLAELNRRVAQGRSPEKEYLELLERIQPQAKKARSWAALTRLTGQLAERAGQQEIALDFYLRERRRLEQANLPEPEELAKKIDTLYEDIDAKRRAKYSAARQLSDRPSLAAIEGPAEKIRLLLGVDSMEMSQRPVVALAGVAPEANLFSSDQVTVLNSTGDGEGMMSEYTTSVISAVQLVAPDAKFIVSSIPGAGASTGAFSASAITEAYFALASESYDILLVPYGPLDSKTFDPILRMAVESGATIVLSAGNNQGEPVPRFEPQVTPSLLVAAAVDLAGARAAFTQHSDDGVWAPGVDVPVTVGGQRGTDRRSGTTYSAAITAGIAARLLAEDPELKAPRLVALLRDSASSREGSGPPVLNLSAALDKLHNAPPAG